VRPPSVCAIVLNWNSAADTINCVSALAAQQYPDCRMLVVDNGSSDDSVRRIRQAYPDLPLLALDENLGYAGGNNRGIARALREGCDYVWLLNPDVVVAADCLSLLVAAAAAHPRAAMLGPLVRMREDGQRILSAGGLLVDGWAQHRASGETDRGQFDRPTEVDYVSGCALLVRRSALESIGLLDERFFLYHEEVEWCHRARTAAFTCLMVPQAIAWHPNTMVRDADSPLVKYYITRNELLLIRTHRLGTSMLLRHLLRHLRTLASWTIRPKWRHKAAQRRALRWALIDFARGRTGQAKRF